MSPSPFSMRRWRMSSGASGLWATSSLRNGVPARWGVFGLSLNGSNPGGLPVDAELLTQVRDLLSIMIGLQTLVLFLGVLAFGYWQVSH